MALVLALQGGRRRADFAVAQDYDLAYAMADGPLLTRPSPFLRAMLLHAATPASGTRTALDIGSGGGRNSLFLARSGYDVTAVDLSEVGLTLTAQQAEAARLPVHTVREDINRFDFGENRWNLILLIDFPFPYRALLPKIAAGLKPGGLAIIQDVSTEQPLEVSPSGRIQYTFMNRRDLDAPFAGFTILHDEEAEEPTEWGVRAMMIRFAARKPTG